jgi:hypothetical protein
MTGESKNDSLVTSYPTDMSLSYSGQSLRLGFTEETGTLS